MELGPLGEGRRTERRASDEKKPPQPPELSSPTAEGRKQSGEEEAAMLKGCTGQRIRLYVRGTILGYKTCAQSDLISASTLLAVVVLVGGYRLWFDDISVTSAMD
ncbi:hypothetical protein E2562_011373 [Oryza meyeriana var. granulata]|uniref:Uncharacterized protein n=1 Tax=Oryza meyeriana var. granulata TaxID=110450 RepID=A0A6G1EAC9_9ORYZ|nr:hypothetical protein E2562_011373 [Oryza meyeriana var. granulata]